MRIVYNGFHGRYCDNPRALFERLGDRRGLQHLWLADPAHAGAFPSEVATVPVEGPEAAAALESADLVIANSHTEVIANSHIERSATGAVWRRPATLATTS